MNVAEHLYITWAAGREFLEVFEGRGSGRYVVRAPAPGTLPANVDTGDTVIVELSFEDSDRRFRHSARVIERREGESESITLEFFEEEREVLDLILCCAGGERVPYLSRRAERYAVWMPVAVLVGDLWRRGVSSELSELGTFVSFSEPPARGTRVSVRFSTLTNRRVEIEAKVVYARRAINTGPGCGLEFVFSSPQEESEIRALLRAVLEPKQG